MGKKTFVQNCIADINYTDVCGKMTKRVPITFMVDARDEAEARELLYMIQKNAYLTMGSNSEDIKEVPNYKGKIA